MIIRILESSKMFRMSYLLVIVSVLVMSAGCDSVDIAKVQNLLNPPTPTGEFEADEWTDFFTDVKLFGEITFEQRGDVHYLVLPSGLGNTSVTMRFADGTTLPVQMIYRWNAGDFVHKIIETDPETGQPLRTVLDGSPTWEMYTETGQLLFTGVYHVVARRHEFQDGIPVAFQSEQPGTCEGVGVGLYEGHTIKFENFITSELRDGKLYLHGVWSGMIE
jgi:hypothetical protein